MRENQQNTFRIITKQIINADIGFTELPKVGTSNRAKVSYKFLFGILYPTHLKFVIENEMGYLSTDDYLVVYREGIDYLLAIGYILYVSTLEDQRKMAERKRSICFRKRSITFEYTEEKFTAMFNLLNEHFKFNFCTLKFQNDDIFGDLLFIKKYRIGEMIYQMFFYTNLQCLDVGRENVYFFTNSQRKYQDLVAYAEQHFQKIDGENNK